MSDKITFSEMFTKLQKGGIAFRSSWTDKFILQIEGFDELALQQYIVSTEQKTVYQLNKDDLLADDWEYQANKNDKVEYDTQTINVISTTEESPVTEETIVELSIDGSTEEIVISVDTTEEIQEPDIKLDETLGQYYSATGPIETEVEDTDKVAPSSETLEEETPEEDTEQEEGRL